MTHQGSPILIKELLQLTTLGIDEGNITDYTLTMSSDKFLCVREKGGSPSQFVIIDMANPTHPVRREFNADYATMNPASKIIALCYLSAWRRVELFNLETKNTMKSHIMNETVWFVKWINADTLAVVTKTAVFHWSTEGESLPKKVFDVDWSVKLRKIVDYRCDDNSQWLLLIGHSPEDPYDGAMQLHSVQRNASQIIVCQAAAFTQFNIEGNSEPSTLLCFASRTRQGGKLHIKELDQPPRGHQPYTEKAVDVYFPPEAKDDIPISMQTSSKHGIIYLINRCGYVHLYDVETASLIYTSRMSDHDILVTVPHESTSGIISVNEKGQVLSVGVDEDNFIPYIKNVLKNPDLALRMAVRHNLPGAEDLFVQKFITLCDHGQYAEVGKFAQNAPEAYSSVLRNTDVKGPAERTGSLFLSKEVGEVVSSGLPVVPEENKVLNDFKELFLSKEDCDVVLNVKGQEFSAHKAILKARSSVFAATFRNAMKEKATGIVNIEDCDPSSFSDFLCFLYCADGNCISEENVFSLFKAADKYDVKDLRSKCLNFMRENLSVDTFCETLVTALQCSETELIQLATEFFIKNSLSIVLTVKWQSFLTANPIQGNELLIKLLKSNKDSSN